MRRKAKPVIGVSREGRAEGVAVGRGEGVKGVLPYIQTTTGDSMDIFFKGDEYHTEQQIEKQNVFTKPVFAFRYPKYFPFCLNKQYVAKQKQNKKENKYILKHMLTRPLRFAYLLINSYRKNNTRH